VDAGEIAWLMINSANTQNPVGLRRGAIIPTQLRDRAYNRKQIAEAIQELTEVENGFDFSITPVDPTVDPGILGIFNVVPAAGVNLSTTVRFEQGEGTLDNVLAVSRQLELPVNRVVVLGAESETTPGVTLTATAEDTASISQYGLYERTYSFTDISVDATLEQRADSLLRPVPIQTITFEPDPATALWPWVDYWLGDTVSVRIDADAFQVQTTARIIGIEIELDDQGNEIAHRVTVGEQHSRTLSDVFGDVWRRLSALER
jgi:hypothetical protein